MIELDLLVWFFVIMVKIVGILYVIINKLIIVLLVVEIKGLFV